MHDDTASLHNSAKSNEGEVLPASVRYVEDESAEWAGLDYDLKVTIPTRKVLITIIRITSKSGISRLASPQPAAQSSCFSGTVESSQVTLYLARSGI